MEKSISPYLSILGRLKNEQTFQFQNVTICSPSVALLLCTSTDLDWMTYSIPLEKSLKSFWKRFKKIWIENLFESFSNFIDWKNLSCVYQPGIFLKPLQYCLWLYTVLKGESSPVLKLYGDLSEQGQLKSNSRMCPRDFIFILFYIYWLIVLLIAQL